MTPGDRIFCLLIEPKQASETFSDWPLHLTIIPWFRTGTASEQLAAELHQRLGELQPFDVVVDGEAKFGARKRLVNLVAEPTPLHFIEHAARGLLHKLDAWLVDESTRQRRPFRPHVTEQASGRLHTGDSFRVEALYFVEQKGDYKEIVSKIQL
jgi:2'-5' RNA ligase